MGILAGKRPNRLGIIDGRLHPARDGTQNTVSSYANSGYARIEPFAAGDAPAKKFERLKALVAQSQGARVVTQDDRYLHAEFSTPLLGFVDDVEFLLDRDARLIHLRSASRLGRKDFGVNRKRIEVLRTKLQPSNGQGTELPSLERTNIELDDVIARPLRPPASCGPLNQRIAAYGPRRRD